MAASAAAASVEVPDGFRLHTENTSHILLSANDAFLNPVQEFNRDTSVACIRTWSEERNYEKEEKWRKTVEAKAARAVGKSNKKLKGVLECLASSPQANAVSSRRWATDHYHRDWGTIGKSIGNAEGGKFRRATSEEPKEARCMREAVLT